VGPERRARALAALQPVARDREEIVEARRELLVPRPPQARLQHRHDLGARPAVHEHDEPEAERALVLRVQQLERAQRVAIGRPVVLLGRRASRQTGGGADPRVCVQDGDPLGLGQVLNDLAGAGDDRGRVAALADALGEGRRALEGLSYPGR